MRANYNGVDLMPLQMHEFNIEPVMDDSKTDYLYSRVTYLAEAVANGQVLVVVGPAPGPAISYSKGAPGPLSTSLSSRGVAPAGTVSFGTRDPALFAPVAGPLPPRAIGLDVGGAATGPVTLIRQPETPPLTHIAIRQRLSQPQGQLFIFNGPGQETGNEFPTDSPPSDLVEILIASPINGRLVDCNNGPKPHLFNIIGDYGDGNSYIVIWGIETFINEADVNGITPTGALLSNRFRQTHNIDDEGYTTIVTEGTALFRSDLIYSNPISPDSLRASMFIPVPQGFTRKIDYVTGLDSAVGIKYGYSDVQVKSNFIAGSFVSAAKISAVHRQAVVTNSDILGGALDVYERALGRKANKHISESEKVLKKVPPATPGGPGAGRLRIPGTPAPKPRRRP